MPDFLELPPSVILRQSRWHGRFLGLHEEMAYQRWHATHWIPRLQLVMLICGLVGLVSFYMGISGAGAVALKASLMRAYPDKAWLLYLARGLACLLPIMCSAVFLSKRAREAVVARRLYQFIPMITWALLVLESAPTTWLANWGTRQHTSSQQDEAAHECSGTIQTRGAYWHAILSDFYTALAGGLLGQRPEYAGVCALLVISFQHFQLEAVWRNSQARRGIEESGPLVPFFMRGIPLITTMLLALVQDRGERQEFRAKTLLQLANTERIEQLKREKDRLGWDIRLDNTRPACAVALDQDAGLSASRDNAAAHHQPSRDGSCAAAAAATEPSSSSLPPPSKQSPRHAAAPPLQSTGDGHRHVAIRFAARAAGGDEQPRCGGAAAAGILREPRVYTSGAASVGGDSASTDHEIMRILPTNASLGARMPRPLRPGTGLSAETAESDAADAGLPKLAEYV